MTQAPGPELVFGIHLVNEITTATQLLAEGLNQVIEPSWYATESATAFTCMASGVERILKLTYGLDALNQGRRFPKEERLRKLGHDLVHLDDLVRPRLAAGAAALRKVYVAELLADVDRDPYWPGVLKTLDSWAAASGRYRDLTILTGRPAPQDPPTAHWAETESACLHDLGLTAALTGPDSRSALVKARTRLAESILRWWHAIFRAWTHGVLGPERVAPGTALAPGANRQLAGPLVASVRAF